MHFPDVLAKHGCGPKRLREIFTATMAEAVADDASAEDKAAHEEKEKTYNIRKKIQDRAWARILEGITHNVKNASLWQAVDMAWDAVPVMKESIPLLLWAQGKLKVEQLLGQLENCSNPQLAGRFFTKDPVSNEVKVDIPRICEFNINLVRSYTTRRLAAMDALWSNLWPQFRYDPRGQSAVSQLRADVITQKVDIMTDQYGYRRQGTQFRRDMLMYSQCVAFPRSAWDLKYGWRFVSVNDGSTPDKTESYIVREGVDFVNPHRTRVFYDFSQPLSGINSDTGPGYIGYWDLVTFGSLTNQGSAYYNLKDVVLSSNWTSLVTSYPAFFSQYFDPCVMKWPDISPDPTRSNSRSDQIGRYSSDHDETGVLTTQYFERINPKLEGIGDYDADIWLRLAIAGSGTVISAEFMPSLPAAYGGLNVNDNRVVNQSMASELLAYQDQLSNIVSHMIQQLRSSYIQMWLIDKDSLDENVRKDIENNAGNKNWWMDPHIITYSGTQLKELGVQDPKAAFQVIQMGIQNAVGNALTAMNQVLNLADRLMILSPNELGQPNPREVAAREVQEISTSVQAIYSFINEGPREMNAAIKQILYESLVTNGSPTVRVPVMRKYTIQTVQEAGFDTIDLNQDDIGGYVPLKTPIQGSLNKLIYDYYFDSRDGAERSLNTQGAQSLTQMLQMLTQVPGVAQKLGLDRLLDIVNTIIRMSGAPIDLQIEKNDGETDAIPPPQAPTPPAQSGPPQGPGGPPPGMPQGAPNPSAGLAQAVSMLGQKQQMDDQRLSRIEQMLSMLTQQAGTAAPQTMQPALAAASATPPAPDPQGNLMLNQ